MNLQKTLDELRAIDALQKMFPRAAGEKNSAVTGLIDIGTFNKREQEIRQLMRAAKLRAIYRGPRRHAYTSMTLRRDAQAVLLYSK